MSTGISPPKRGCVVENEIQEKSNHVSAESKIYLCNFLTEKKAEVSQQVDGPTLEPS